MFGTNYIPVRRCETHDGIMFGWCMGNGALAVGLLARAFVGGDILTLGIAGGTIWALSNALVLPVVKLLGLGVGFALYHGVNLVVGYSVGRFGWLGAPRDMPHVPALCDGAVAVLLASLAVMVMVVPDMSHGGKRRSAARAEVTDHIEPSAAVEQAATGARAGGVPVLRQALLPPHADSAAASGGLSVSRVESSPSGGLARATLAPAPLASADGYEAFAAGAHAAIGVAVSYSALLPAQQHAAPAAGPPPLGPAARKLWGVLLALLAGLLAGVNAVPFLVWTRTQRGADERALHFLFANLLGVYAGASALYVGASVVQSARGVRVPHSPVRPAYLSGALWAIGCGGQLLAIDNLGMSTAYVLCAIGPVMVSALASALLFREIRGVHNRRTFAVALALQFVGVTMLAAGS